MFRCLRSQPPACGPPLSWRTPLASLPGSSRGIKLGKLTRAAVQQQVPAAMPDSTAYSLSGKKQLARLYASGVVLHPVLKPLPAAYWGGLKVKMASQHAVGSSDLRYFTDVGNGYTEAIVQRKLANHRDHPLWLLTGIKGDTKPIVRGRAKYRFNAALKQALRNAGYDAHGRRLPEDAWLRQKEIMAAADGVDAAQQERRPRFAQLYGTVEFVTWDATWVHATPFAELRAHLTKVVGILEDKIGVAEGRCSDQARASGGSSASAGVKKASGQTRSQSRRKAA